LGNVKYWSAHFFIMHIQRSQSAPQPIAIDALFCPSEPRAGTLNGLQANISRSKSYLIQPVLATSWVERDDPFNLGGFFPASNRAASEHGEQWKWLYKEDEDAARADKGSISSFFVQDDYSTAGQLGEELAEETIKGEDKFGLLALGDDLVRPLSRMLTNQLLSR